jgi:hypothetical protein
MNNTSKVGLTILLCFFLWAACLKPSRSQTKASEPGISASVERAREAGVPEPALNRILILGNDYGISTDDLDGFLLAVQAVQQENLPVGPFVDKIAEGLAKGIPAQTIRRVLWRKTDDYRFVLGVFQRTAEVDQPSWLLSHEDLNRVAGSLDAGISRDELARFIERAPPSQMSMLARAVEVLALLKQIQFDEPLAEDILFTGLRNKSFTQSWTYLAKIVATARHRGRTDREIATAARDALGKKRSFNEFMAALGFTSRDVRHGPAVGRRSNTAP